MTECFSEEKNREKVSQEFKTLDRILSDKWKRLFFKRFLHLNPEGDTMVQEIADRYEAKEAFTTEQITFLNRRLVQFQERMVLAEEAKLLFSDEEFTDAAAGHEFLQGVLALNTHATRILRMYLGVIAVENPGELRRIMDLQRTINEKKKAAQGSASDSPIQMDLLREIGEHQHAIADTIMSIVSRDDEVMRAFAYTRFKEQKEKKKQKEDHKEEEAPVVPAKNEEQWKDATKEVLRAFGKETKDFVGGEAEWLGDIATALFGSATGISIGRHHQPHKSTEERKEKKPKSEHIDEYSYLKDERYKDPEEMLRAFTKLLGEEDFDGARVLLARHFPRDREARKVYSEISRSLKKKDTETAIKLMKEHLHLDDEEEIE